MPDYTPTQGRYLAFIHAYTQGFGEPPAESEIAEALGVRPPSAHLMVKTLEKKGLIRRQPGRPRSIEILIAPEDLPPWPEKIVRTVYQWVQAQPPKRDEAEPSVIYQLKITLLEFRPPIWRRIETKDVELRELNELIQTSMGWTNSHLHQFEFDGKRYTDPRLMADVYLDEHDYTGIYLSDLVREHGPKLKMLYEYDFGDRWRHSVVLEKFKEAERGQKYPRCTAGKRKCPPEDIGGVWGYADYLEALANPDHEEHEDALEWSGPFDPEDFDPVRATRAMRRGLPFW